MKCQKGVLVLVLALSFVLLSFFVVASDFNISSPANNSFIRGNYQIVVSINSSVYQVTNVSFSYNGTLIGTNSSVNLSSYTFSWNTNSVADGNYNISIIAVNASFNSYNLTNSNITVDNTFPIVSLLTANSSSFSNFSGPVWVSLNCSASDINGLINLSLFTNLSGSWQINSTVSCSGSTCSSVFNFSFSGNSTIFWNCQAVDLVYNAGFNKSNFSVSLIGIDIILPISNASDLVANDSDSDGNIEISWINDTFESGETYRLYRYSSVINSSTIINASLIASGILESTQVWEDNTSRHNNTYWYAVITVDSSGNFNLSVVSSSVFATSNDTFKPKLTSSLNATNLSDGSVRIYWAEVTLDVGSNSDRNNAYKVFKIAGNNLSTLNTSTNTNLLLTTSSLSFNDSDVTENLTYTYVVCTLDDALNLNLTIAGTNNVTINVSQCYTEWSSWDDWSDCSSGSQIRSRTRTCFNAASSQSESRDCLASSYSSGGGSSSTMLSNRFSASWSTLGKGDQLFLSIGNSNVPFTQITGVVTETLSNPQISIEKVSKLNSIPSPDNVVFSYLTVTERKLRSDSVIDVSITFYVSKSWFNDAPYKPENIVLLRYDNGWKTLPTKLSGDDNEKYYFVSNSPGLSTFAIALKENGASSQTPVSLTSESTLTTISVVTTTLPIVISSSTTVKEIIEEFPSQVVKKGNSLRIWVFILGLTMIVIIAAAFVFNAFGDVKEGSYVRIKEKFSHIEGEIAPPHSNNKTQNASIIEGKYKSHSKTLKVDSVDLASNHYKEAELHYREAQSHYQEAINLKNKGFFNEAKKHISEGRIHDLHSARHLSLYSEHIIKRK